MKSFLLSILYIVVSLPAVCQNYLKITGYVRDKLTGESLIGATIHSKDWQIGAVTNEYGFFQIRLPKGSINLDVSYVGYSTLHAQLTLTKDSLVNFSLESALLDEVVITEKLTAAQLDPMNINRVSLENLTKMPMLLGEVDIVKALTLLPGVSTGVEGTSGLNVRGGTPDQNLVLIDESTVYNLSHLFGYISTFNNDAIKEVNLIKGGFPARYGGRLSSVLDVQLKEGNKNEVKGSYSMGVVTSKFFIEGPLKKETTSFLIAARFGYLGLLLLPQRLSYQAGSSDAYTTYWMFDGSAKVNHRMKGGGQITGSYFSGQDLVKTLDGSLGSSSRNKTLLNWGNSTATIRYAKNLRNGSFIKIMGLYSHYSYQYSITNIDSDSTNSFRSKYSTVSGVRDYGIKSEWALNPSFNHKVRVGVQSTFHDYTAGKLETNILELQFRKDPKIYALETVAYLEDEWSITDKLKTHVGLRSGVFNVQDKSYPTFEPRIAMSYQLGSYLVARGSYSYMRQFIHLLSNNSGLTNDIWVPSTPTVKPEISNQYSLGLLRNFPGANFEVSIDGFYKTMSNLIDYRRGANILFSLEKSWEELIVKNGIGNVRGLELFAYKKQGDFTGWLSYTVSKNERKFGDINNGEWYPARYDRRHSVSLTGSYEISPSWRYSANWVFNSGQPVTLPVAISTGLYGEPTFIYGNRNNVRMPAYHRLDIGFEHTYEKRGSQRSLSFGAYNTYNRINPYYLTFRHFGYGEPHQQNKLLKVSILQVIPYISFTRWF